MYIYICIYIYMYVCVYIYIWRPGGGYWDFGVTRTCKACSANKGLKEQGNPVYRKGLPRNLDAGLINAKA